jgi:hypothetical protein
MRASSYASKTIVRTTDREELTDHDSKPQTVPPITGFGAYFHLRPRGLPYRRLCEPRKRSPGNPLQNNEQHHYTNY